MESRPSSVDREGFYRILEEYISAYPRSMESELMRTIRDGDDRRLAGIVSRMDYHDREKLANVSMNGLGLLHVASHFDNVEVCKFLVDELHFDLNASGLTGRTPLSCASYCGEEGVSRFLIKRGSDPNKKDNRGCVPLHNAAQNGNKEVVRLLLVGGAKVNLAIAKGTAVHIAASYGNTAALKTLLDHRADPNWISEDAGTPLIAALASTKFGVSEKDSLECIKLLIKAGADVNFTDPDPPLEVATVFGLTDCVEYLLKAGADANIEDKYIAASNGNRTLVETLFRYTFPLRQWPNGILKGFLLMRNFVSQLRRQFDKTSATSSLTIASPRAGDFPQEGQPHFYTPQNKKSRTSDNTPSSSGSTTTKRGSHSIESKSEKFQSGTLKVRRCKRVLQYSLGSDSSDESSSPSSPRLGVITLRVYASMYKSSPRESFRVPCQNTTRRMTGRGPKIIFRRCFMSASKRHCRNKVMYGCFTAENFVVDLVDNTVNIQGVAELPYTAIGRKMDRLQFVKMVREEVFGGKGIPDDLHYWLELISDDKDPWEPKLLANHIYMLDSRQAYGTFMSFVSTIHGLRRDKPLKYLALRDLKIFDKYLGWNPKFRFSLLNDTMAYVNPVTGLEVYDPDVMGLIWLFRCCWQHKAQKYPHLLVAVVLGERVPDLLSDVQKALYDAGILRDLV